MKPKIIKIADKYIVQTVHAATGLPVAPELCKSFDTKKDAVEYVAWAGLK